jgi:hypothetical protein
MVLFEVHGIKSVHITILVEKSSDQLFISELMPWTTEAQRNLKFWADVADKICFGRT